MKNDVSIVNVYCFIFFCVTCSMARGCCILKKVKEICWYLFVDALKNLDINFQLDFSTTERFLFRLDSLTKNSFEFVVSKIDTK